MTLHLDERRDAVGVVWVGQDAYADFHLSRRGVCKNCLSQLCLTHSHSLWKTVTTHRKLKAVGMGAAFLQRCLPCTELYSQLHAISALYQVWLFI